MRGVIPCGGAVVVIGLVANGCDPNMALVGTPCVPTVEDDPTFLGLDPNEVTLSASLSEMEKGTIACLSYHFRGRITCPYGQDATGTQLPAVDSASGGPFPVGVGPCRTTSGEKVTGDPTIPTVGALVHPQCLDRRAKDVVTWTCRCANGMGRNDDGATYCSCPSGTICSQLDCVDVCSPLGAYCIRQGTEYQSFSACIAACDPSTTTCS